MRLVTREQVTDAGGKGNDDRGGSNRSGAWVIDGATSLGPGHFGPMSDASWLAQQFADEISVLLGRADVIDEEALSLSRSRVQERFEAATGIAVSDLIEEPAASLCFIHLIDKQVRLHNLGDCRIYFWDRSTSITHFGSSRVESFDAGLVSQLRKAQAAQKDATFSDIWQQLVPSIQRNRSKANTAEGYWVARMSGDWECEVQTCKIDAMEERHFLLCSDGFYRAFDILNIFAQDDIPGVLETHGLHWMLDQLRQFEDADSECRRFPRIKPRDDATAIWLTLKP